LIHAAAPFPAETFDEVKERISAGSYEINVNISLELKNLIMSILQFDPKDRPTLLEIKKNPWILKMKK
jgi:serine/threonine protein kinase